MAEFAAVGLGALLLSLAGWSPYLPVLVAGVVGPHFFPLVPVLGDPLLRVLGAGTGLALLGYAVVALGGTIRHG